jgi:hypothetical protein
MTRMAYPPVPRPSDIAAHFAGALRDAERVETPYIRWKLSNVFPLDLCTAILVLPIVPPMLGATDGTRDSYNRLRTFITPELRDQFPACQALAEAMQHPAVVAQFRQTCAINTDGAYLRAEYMQDTDGMWLEPHRDIAEKLFSMVVYLCTGPDAPDRGTDIYDHDKRWIGRSPAEFNTASIFKAGPHTWHGFEKRPIRGVRRLMEINYVRGWRDRAQLAFPERAIHGNESKQAVLF